MPLRIVPKRKGRSFRNTRRENRLEELGRVDAEKAYTSKGKRNLREEKDRIRSELKSGGRPATRPMTPDQRRQPRKTKAGPKAASSRKKFRTHGGGPDSGNIGKIKDAASRAKDVMGKKAGPSPEDLQRIRDKMNKPKQMQPLRKGGSAKKPRPHGPHMWVRDNKRKKYASGGVVMAGKKVVCQIK